MEWLEGRLLVRARAAGQVRPCVTAGDIGALMCGLGGIVAMTDHDAAWRRYLTIVLDRLRA